MPAHQRSATRTSAAVTWPWRISTGAITMVALLVWATATTEAQPRPASHAVACVRPATVKRLTFSARKYPNIRRHFRGAVRHGWPRTLVLNRPGADQRRDRLLRGIPTRPGYDRDEYPPAVARGRGPGLRRGTHPRGWKADVRYVRNSENRSHGATLGNKLERYCNGTRFRYVFR